MEFGGIQFGGLASGLDTQAIIQAILGVERVPINQLQARVETENSKLSLFGTLKGHVSSLRDKAEALSTSGGLLEFSVTASEEGVASFSVTGAPPTGAHTLQVNSLASADRWTFTDEVSDPDADLGVGTQQLSFDINSVSYAFTIDSADSSLNEIAEEINSLAGDDVTASVINTGTSGSPSYQLVIAGDNTGEDYAITNLASTIDGLTTTEQLTVAANAEIEVDGLTIQRESNVFEDVIEGLTINAESVNTSSPITFTADIDATAVEANLQSFIDDYNEVINFINDQNVYTEDDGAGGLLFGDASLRSIRSTINAALFNVDPSVVAADTTGFSTLGLVGVDLNTDGTLSLDSATLASKLTEDPEAFADLFADEDGFDNTGAAVNTSGFYEDTTADSGLFATLFREIDRMVEAQELADGSFYDGIFDRREEAIRSDVDRMDDRIQALEDRLVTKEDQLVAQYTALEQLIAGLNSQGAALTAGLG